MTYLAMSLFLIVVRFALYSPCEAELTLLAAQVPLQCHLATLAFIRGEPFKAF